MKKCNYEIEILIRDIIQLADALNGRVQVIVKGGYR
jgi:hypothetical protein